MEKNDFTSSISAKISAAEAVKRISCVPEWWGITFSGSSEKQNDKFIVKMGPDSFLNFIVAELIQRYRQEYFWLLATEYQL